MVGEIIGRTEFLVDADTKPLHRSLRRAEKDSEKQGLAAGEAFGDGLEKGVKSGTKGVDVEVTKWGKRTSVSMEKTGRDGGKRFGEGFWKSVRSSFKNPFDGLDDDVKLVLGLIATSAPGIAGLLSALSAGLVGIVASAAGAASALGALTAVLPNFAYGMSLATAGLGRIDELAPQAASSLGELKRVFQEVDVPRFMAEWEGSLATFLDTLANTLEFDQVAEATGQAFARVTDAFTGVLNSPAFQAFHEAMETTLPDALGSLGEGFAGFAEVVSAVFAAAAPVVKALADNFAAFAEDLAETATTALQDGSLTEFFERAADSLDIVLFLVGELGRLFGILGSAGQAFGDTFIATVASLIGVWNDWLESVEGQAVLEEWFSNASIIMRNLLEIVIVLGQTLGNLVTPESTEQLSNFLTSIANFLPILGEVLGLVTNLQILNILAALFDAVRIALEPVLPIIGEFATALGEALMGIIPALTPLLAALVAALAAILPALTPLLDPLVTLVETLASALVPVVEALTPLLVLLAEAIAVSLDGAIQIINPILEILGDLLVIVADVLTAILIPAIGASITIFNKIIAAIKPLINAVLPKLREWLGKVKDGTKTVVDIAKLLRDTFDRLANKITDKVVGAFESASTWISDLIDWFDSLGDTVANIVDGIVGAIGRISWPTPPAWLTSVFGGGTPAYATGGVVTGPTKALIGEAGPEMVVPLARPLSMVDPAVRDVAAYAQGKTPAMANGGIAGGGVTIEAGAITVLSPYANSRLVAEDVMDQLVLQGK